MFGRVSVLRGTTLLLVFAVSAAIVFYFFVDGTRTRRPASDELLGVLRPEPKGLTQFSLIDQEGRPFELERFSGNWSLVFFGYTFCPDICPTTMATLVSVFSQLAAQQVEMDRLQVFFVSVDPARDTPEVLRGYMHYFGKNFTGVTGEKVQLDNFARQFGAGYLIEPERAPGEYLVSHTSSIFLVGPNRRLLAHFSPPHDSTTIAEQFRQIKTLYQ